MRADDRLVGHHSRGFVAAGRACRGLCSLSDVGRVAPQDLSASIMIESVVPRGVSVEGRPRPLFVRSFTFRLSPHCLHPLSCGRAAQRQQLRCCTAAAATAAIIRSHHHATTGALRRRPPAKSPRPGGPAAAPGGLLRRARIRSARIQPTLTLLTLAGPQKRVPPSTLQMNLPSKEPPKSRV